MLSWGQAAASTRINLPILVDDVASQLKLDFSSFTPTKVHYSSTFGRHTQFEVNLTGFSTAPGSNYFDSLFSQPATIDIYLYPSSDSFFVLQWKAEPQCHGDCRTTAEFYLSFRNSTPDLFFADSVPEDFYQGFEGSGTLLLVDYSNHPPEPLRPISATLTNFTVTAPEAGALPLALGGLGMVAWAIAARKKPKL